MQIIMGCAFSKGRVIPDISSPYVLDPGQASLIPQVGDIVTGSVYQNQYKVVERVFSLNVDSVTVTLVCEPY